MKRKTKRRKKIEKKQPPPCQGSRRPFEKIILDAPSKLDPPTHVLNQFGFGVTPQVDSQCFLRSEYVL